MYKKIKQVSLLIITTLFISSCASYSCKAPNGSSCKSVRTVYGEEMAESTSDIEEVRAIIKKNRVEQKSMYEDKSPLWTPAKKLRLWLSRWVDAKGIYHQPGYLYIEVEKGRWITEKAEIDETILEDETTALEAREEKENNGNTD